MYPVVSIGSPHGMYVVASATSIVQASYAAKRPLSLLSLMLRAQKKQVVTEVHM